MSFEHTDGGALQPAPQRQPRSGLELLSRKELAALTGLPVKFFENAVWRGDGPPFVKISRRTVRYRRSDVEAWLASRLVDPGSTGEPGRRKKSRAA